MDDPQVRIWVHFSLPEKFKLSTKTPRTELMASNDLQKDLRSWKINQRSQLSRSENCTTKDWKQGGVGEEKDSDDTEDKSQA